MSDTKNIIHPTAVVDPDVKMGSGNYIGPHCVIAGPVKIGSGNRFEAFCTIGTPPEHEHFWKSKFESVVIGDNCMIREFVTINAGTVSNTTLESRVNILRGAYVGHDSHIEWGVTLSANSLLGGHCHVFQGANLGLNVAVHQFSVIGHYAMLGMSTVVTKKSRIEPGNTYVGVPARFLKINQVGLTRNQISETDLSTFCRQFSDKIEELQNRRRKIQLSPR